MTQERYDDLEVAGEKVTLKGEFNNHVNDEAKHGNVSDANVIDIIEGYGQTIDATVTNALNGGGGSAEHGDIINIKDHGGVGNGSTDNTTALNNALSEAVDVGGGTVYLPSGDYIVNDEFTIPQGVSIVGSGRSTTTITSTASSAITFDMESYSSVKHFTLDQNVEGRPHTGTRGIEIMEANNCLVEDIRFINLSTTYQGLCVLLEAEETHSQDTHSNIIRDCHCEGTFQNGDNGGDFLIRARTAFASDLQTDQFTRFLRDNIIENCYFTGEAKSAVELVGPATRHNVVTNCIARDYTTCVGAFEASLGAKDNLFANCQVIDAFGDSGLIGFYADGYQVSGKPTRYSEDNTFINCHVKNCQEIQEGSYIRGFRVRVGKRDKFIGCSANNINAHSNSHTLASAFDITQGENVMIDSPRIVSVHRGARLNSAVLPRINTPFFHDVSNPVHEETSSDRPRWNGVLGGGEFGGVNLSSSSGYFVGDTAVDENTLLNAKWTGSQWRRSDNVTI